ncbi:MAG: class I SAM-dependent methyltransferase [Chloroflexota bacterium]
MDIPWLYDEQRETGTGFADEATAREWDTRAQQQRAFGHEAETIAEELSLTPDSLVWEIGTGGGELALNLARRCKQVYASDTSPTMLDIARKKARERSIGNVMFEQGGFLSGFTPPWPVDGIIIQLTLHHLPDFWKLAALKRIGGFLKRNGMLYLRDIFFPSKIPDYNAYIAGMLAAIQATSGPELADQTAAHIKDEYSTFAWIIEEMLAQAGFEVLRSRQHRFTTAYTCVSNRSTGPTGR